MNYGRIDHLRSQADDAEAFLLRLFKGVNNLGGFVDLYLRRSKSGVNHRYLRGMDAPHAFESHRAGIFSPTPETVEVADIAVDRVDRLNACGPRSIDQTRASIR